MERYLLDGQITLNERDTIRERLHDIIRTHTEFFDDRWEVINEKEIMVSERGESRIYRPDRILKGPDGYIIVDFKTGEPSEKDKHQIENYKRVLERLGRKVIDTRLVYL